MTGKNSGGNGNGKAKTPVKLMNKGLAEKYRKRTEVAQGKRVAFIGHLDADADYIASGYLLKSELEHRGIPADLIIVGQPTHPQNQCMLNSLDIEYQTEKYLEENLGSFEVFVSLDAQIENNAIKRTESLSDALKNIEFDIIIDHHEQSIVPPKKCLNIHRRVGAVSTIAYRLVQELGFNITSEQATAINIGINADTKHLTKKDETRDEDREVHNETRMMYDYELWAGITLFYEIPMELLMMKGLAYNKHFFQEGKLVLAGVENITGGQRDLCAEIVDEMLRVEEIRLAAVIGIENGKRTQAKARSDLNTVNINEFCKYVFEDQTVTDHGSTTAGGRTGSGGATVVWSNREIEEYEEADETEQSALFCVKMRRYLNRAKQELGKASKDD